MSRKRSKCSVCQERVKPTELRWVNPSQPEFLAHERCWDHSEGAWMLVQPVDSTTARKQAGGGRKRAESGERIRKLTPLERAIAKKQNPRLRWDDKQEAAGIKRTTVMMRLDCRSEWQEFNKALREYEGDACEALKRFIGELAAS